MFGYYEEHCWEHSRTSFCMDPQLQGVIQDFTRLSARSLFSQMNDPPKKNFVGDESWTPYPAEGLDVMVSNQPDYA